MNEILKIISKFSHPQSRLNAAIELAGLLGAEQVLCFQYDEIVKCFLPSEGFPQTIKFAQQWQTYLDEACGRSIFNSILNLEGRDNQVSSICVDKSVLVIIGCILEESLASELVDAFTLLSALLKSEAHNRDLEGVIKTLEQSSNKSELLTRHLDIARDQLQNALKTEEEFLSIASHELKTPITSLHAFLEILLQTFPPEKDKQTNYFLNRAKVQVQRLISLISELLDVTKIKAGKLELQYSVVNLKELVEELVQDYSSTGSSHKIIAKDFPEIMISCDKNRIEQVLSNLLSNAIKYSPASDSILLNVIEEDEFIQVNIHDYGIGIAEKNKLKVFDRFFREHKGETGMLSSLGLGLYICADIIKSHNGKIWVDSGIESGTTFHFTLPKIKQNHSLKIKELYEENIGG